MSERLYGGKTIEALLANSKNTIAVYGAGENSTSQTYVDLVAHIRELEKALEFYAEGKHWEQDIDKAVADDMKYYYYLLAEHRVAVESGGVAIEALRGEK